MKINLNYSSIAFFLFIFFITGCNKDKNIYFEYMHIPDSEWDKNTEAVFTPVIDVNQIGKPYNISIELRHTNNYPYQNIWLFPSIFYKDSLLKTDTLQYLLADNFGEWYGKGYNALYQQSLLYKNNFLFPDTGEYTIRILHAMRDPVLIGVEDIGVRIESE